MSIPISGLLKIGLSPIIPGINANVIDSNITEVLLLYLVRVRIEVTQDKRIVEYSNDKILPAPLFHETSRTSLTQWRQRV